MKHAPLKSLAAAALGAAIVAAGAGPAAAVGGIVPGISGGTSGSPLDQVTTIVPLSQVTDQVLRSGGQQLSGDRLVGATPLGQLSNLSQLSGGLPSAR